MSGTPGGEDIDVDADPLDLTSLDSESLFKALTAVEKAIPDLLLSVKPILASLSTQTSPEDEEDMGVKAREGIETYMTLLDKIQFVLRQTVYYLHETKAPLTTLQPANPFSLPTPFASSLPASSTNPSRISSARAGDENKAELGLYGSRLELRVLDDMVASLQALRRKQEESNSSDS